MSESWTPGPWITADNNPLIVQTVARDRGRYRAVAKVYTGAEAEANARLVAAATELYAALAEVLSAWCSESGMGTVYEMQRAIPTVRAALAKARGKQ